MLMKPVFAVLGAISLLAAAGSSVARTASDDTITVKVSYGDLNLDNPEGAKTMLARIHHAALAVCNDGQDEQWDMAIRDRVRTCVRRSSADAVTALANPMVTALSQGDGRAMVAFLAGH